MAETSRAPGALYLRAQEFLARRLESDEKGQGMVEYGLILVLIAIVVIVILQVVGKQINNVFSNVSNGLSH
jgi:pilus assembly protein Flp/PilA